MPLSIVINVTVSEVQDYRSVETAGVPDYRVNGAAAGSIMYLLAELIDSVLRPFAANDIGLGVCGLRRRQGGSGAGSRLQLGDERR
ncbi:hypothetical protein [Mycobacterium uberis]|uniref:hypothetical protein n=1 Tax=Mycobacterium uberis TaxID=2162698 RepID=UPI000E30B219|nr:hypothetical protein [Mycobacterium uberis]